MGRMVRMAIFVLRHTVSIETQQIGGGRHFATAAQRISSRPAARWRMATILVALQQFGQLIVLLLLQQQLFTVSFRFELFAVVDLRLGALGHPAIVLWRTVVFV